MKTLLNISPIIWSVSLLPFPGVASLESLSFTIDNGGGAIAGGTFAISGTTGQPDSSAVTGGSYLLEGGFWNGATFDSKETPRLYISKSGADTVVSWSLPATGFLLQWAPSLATNAIWNYVPFPYATSSTHITHSDPATIGPRYYRLRK